MRALAGSIWRWSQQLSVRVTAFVAAIVVVFAVTGVLTNIRSGREVLLQRLLERANELSGFVAEITANQVDELKAFELEIILEDLAQQQDVRLAEIVDAKGIVVADGDNRSTLFLAKSSTAAVEKALATGEKVVIHDDQSVDVAVPVRLGPRLVGVVHLTMSLDSVHAAVTALTWQAFRWGMILLGLALPVTAFCTIRLTRRIGLVTAAARQIASGDFDFAFRETTSGEVGELQAAFNHMKAALQQNLLEIERLAYTDPVTGLSNRQAFRRMVDRTLQKASPREQGAVLFIDLDRFKKVNDNFGHHVGDSLLTLVSARIDDVLKTFRNVMGDVLVARQGGDEFTVLLVRTKSPVTAEVVAESLVAALSEPFSLQDQRIVIGASIGIALYPADAGDHETLLRKADLAMYSAKESGRRTVRVYSPELEQLSLERLTLEGELRKAIAEHELTVYYQPKVSCIDGRLVGAEALVRWNHPTRGLLAPAQFLPLAEEVGLIADLSWYVLERAVMEASRIAPGEDPISIAVNVSARQFEEAHFTERVAAILDRFTLDPALLELELTESIAMGDPDSVIERIAPLKARGVRFAIDDFGTGYSSLSYLTRLPIDVVKIDRSFIKAVRNSANDRTLVTTILRMAESLSFQTVAEGIESEEDFQFVREHGASTAQGFLFSPAVPYQDYLVLCASFRRGSGRVRPDEARLQA
jgi:diguanylate cyclase (GGDEF)-like protein